MPLRLGLCFSGDEPMFDRCVWFGLPYSHRTTTLALRVFYRTGHSFCADVSYLLIPINAPPHVGLNPSIYGRAARLQTECTQAGDSLAHSHVHIVPST